MPNRSRTPARISRASASRSAVRRGPPVGQRQRVLARHLHGRRLARAVSLAEPGRSISQAAETFTRPSGSSQCGTSAGSSRSTSSRVMTGLVKNEPALQVSWSAGSSTMPLARRSSRTACRTSARGALGSDVDTESRGQLGIADRAGRRCGFEPERHTQHDVLVVALEPAVPVGEPAVLRSHADDLAGGPLEHAHRGDGLRDLLPVGADVLDRGGADQAGDAGQGLDAGQPVRDRARDERVPVLAGSDGQLAAGALDPAGRDLHDQPVEALVRDHDVAAAAEDEHGLAGGIGGADGVHEVGFGVHDHEPASRPAQPQRGALRQRGGGQLGGAHVRRAGRRPGRGRGPSLRRR